MAKKDKSVRRGFTLVEMIIAVIIMGILAGGAYQVYGNSAERARYEQAEKDLDMLLAAAGAAYTNAGSFGTVASGALQNAFSGSFKSALEQQLSRSLADTKDPWGNSYYISNTGGKIIVQCVKSGTTVRTNPTKNNRSMYRNIYNGG